MILVILSLFSKERGEKLRREIFCEATSANTEKKKNSR